MTACVHVLRIVVSLTVFVIMAGCASLKQEAQTDAPDGFYTATSGTKVDYTLRTVAPTGARATTFGLQPCAVFVPNRVVVFDAPEGWYVQISGLAPAERWSEQGIILVANHKPYFELRKSGQTVSEDGQRVGPAATISLILSTRTEAEAVAAALRRRYGL